MTDFILTDSFFIYFVSALAIAFVLVVAFCTYMQDHDDNTRNKHFPHSHKTKKA